MNWNIHDALIGFQSFLAGTVWGAVLVGGYVRSESRRLMKTAQDLRIKNIIDDKGIEQ